jgi:Ca-activated chloride channel family protein
MTFLTPILLLGLLLVPVLAGLYLLVQRRRTRYAVRFTNLDLLANLAPRRPAWRRHIPAAIYLGAVGALALALARPTMVMAVPRDDAAVILTIDVSGSMSAVDVAPTRLDAAKSAADSFIGQLPPNVRVGVVSFSDQAETVLGPTSDRAQAKAAIDGLQPERGTAMGDGLMQALDIAQTIQQEGTALGTNKAPVDQPSGQPLVAAILLSDGASTTGDADPLDAAARAATMNVPVYTIALGTADGKVTVPDQNGQPTTLDVPPDTATLAKIAETTNGIAFDAPTAKDLKAVYDNLQSRVGYTDEQQEVTVFFAGAALILVVAAAGLSALWFGRLP